MFRASGVKVLHGAVEFFDNGIYQRIVMPELSSAVPPILPPNLVKLVLTEYSSFDAGRGCPFQCSFCTIINVQGRISRYRTADDVEAIVRANRAQGVPGARTISPRL